MQGATTIPAACLGRLAKKNSIVHQLVYLLAHVRPLRQAVWTLEPPATPDAQNLVVQLQRVVRHLRGNDGAAATAQPAQPEPVDLTPLLSAFGWSSQEQYLHTDISELFHVLLEQLTRCEKVDAQFTLSRMFGGELSYTLKWVNTSTVTGHQPSSSRHESVLSATLQCKGCNHITDALKIFHASERIDDVLYGEEGWRGDADRSVLWSKLPPVLFFDIRRVDFDFETMARVPVDTRFEFTTFLDMQPYVDPATIEDKENKDDKDKQRKRMVYQLAAVLSYYQTPGGVSLHTFVRDIGASDSWVHFSDNDARVCTEEQAVTENFGGSGGTTRKVTGLVYVRCDTLPPTSMDSLKLQAAYALAEQQQDTASTTAPKADQKAMPSELEELVSAVRESPYLVPEQVPQQVQDWWKTRVKSS